MIDNYLRSFENFDFVMNWVIDGFVDRDHFFDNHGLVNWDNLLVDDGLVNSWVVTMTITTAIDPGIDGRGRQSHQNGDNQANTN